MRRVMMIRVVFLAFSILLVKEISLVSWKGWGESHSVWVKLKQMEAEATDIFIKYSIQLSEYSDLLIRMQFQRNQVDRYCERMGLREVAFTLPETDSQKTQSLTHIVTNSSKIMFCYADNTEFVKYFRMMILGHHQTTGTDDSIITDHPLPVVKETATLRAQAGDKPSAVATSGAPATDGPSAVVTIQTSTVTKTPPPHPNPNHMQHFWKFTFVSNPLQRLLLIYLQYLQDPLYESSDHFPNNLKQEIFEKYRPVVYQHWIKMGGAYNISITFSEFIQYYVESLKAQLHVQMQPYTEICHPCRYRYDFYGRQGRLVSELNIIMKHLGLEWDLWKNRFQPPKFNITHLMLEYYSRLTVVEKTQLYDAIRQELLFYYHLYPQDRFSHVTLLGINEQLYHIIKK